MYRKISGEGIIKKKKIRSDLNYVDEGSIDMGDNLQGVTGQPTKLAIDHR